jgi:hypothetical protein
MKTEHYKAPDKNTPLSFYDEVLAALEIISRQLSEAEDWRNRQGIDFNKFKEKTTISK